MAMRKDRIPYSWTPMKYLKAETDTIYLIKWQTKFNSYMPNNVKECPFCKDQIYFWKHFLDCKYFKGFTQVCVNNI